MGGNLRPSLLKCMMLSEKVELPLVQLTIYYEHVHLLFAKSVILVDKLDFPLYKYRVSMKSCHFR